MKRSLTLQCIAGLVLGVLAGLFLPRLWPEAMGNALGGADLAIRAWTNALRLVVTPLVATQLFVAVSPHRASKGDAAVLGAGIPLVFFGLLAVTMLITLLVTSGLLATPLLKDLSFSGIDVQSAAASARAAKATAGGWLDDVIPSNLFAAAARPEAILGLMLFSLAFALAARRLAADAQELLVAGARAIRDTMFVLIGWLLLLAPALIFALALRSTVDSGLALGRLLLWYTVVELVCLVACTLALYPLTMLGGGVSLGRFARAAFPAQVTAAASRSSLATVPVLLRDAETHLVLPPKVSSLVIPLGGATLKLSRAVSSPVKLLFISHFLGLTVTPGQLLVFCATILLLSPSTPGVPSVVSGARSTPAFVAVGVAPEYVMLFGATTSVLDLVMTVLNATGYLSAAALVARLVTARAGRVGAPVPAEGPSPGPLG